MVFLLSIELPVRVKAGNLLPLTACWINCDGEDC